MDYAKNIRSLFAVLTVLVIGTVSFVKMGTINAHSVFATSMLLIPAVIVMGLLGHQIGTVIDNPKNRVDADYKIAVLNALKKMDKSMTLQDLNAKLANDISEEDASFSDIDDDYDE